MNFLRWMELLLFLLAVITAWTQLIVPLWKGAPVFPFFRKSQRIAGEIKEAQESVEVAKLQKHLKRERDRADKLGEESEQQ